MPRTPTLCSSGARTASSSSTSSTSRPSRSSSPLPDLVVAGAGMAGLAAAARARELGADDVVHEKGTRLGGSMYLSSCVVWRYRDFERFREECPGGDPELQRVVWEGLDDALAWLEGLGAPVVARETGNPLTRGVRFEPKRLPGRRRARPRARHAGSAASRPAGEPLEQWRRASARA